MNLRNYRGRLTRLPLIQISGKDHAHDTHWNMGKREESVVRTAQAVIVKGNTSCCVCTRIMGVIKAQSCKLVIGCMLVTIDGSIKGSTLFRAYWKLLGDSKVLYPSLSQQNSHHKLQDYRQSSHQVISMLDTLNI